MTPKTSLGVVEATIQFVQAGSAVGLTNWRACSRENRVCSRENRHPNATTAVTVIGTQIQHTFMSEAGEPPEKTTVNIRMTESFLADVDAAWRDAGYGSRSEFVRAVLRDAVKHPEFNRADLKAMLAGEADIREGRTHSSADVKAEYGLDGGDDSE